MRKVGRMGLVLVVAPALSALAGIGVLWAWSPGTMEPFLDANGNPVAGSVSEKLFLDVNGVRQGMFITGRDVSNPVLLYLHGGLPEFFLAPHYPTGLEDLFTIVWWEQRGSGISWSPSIPQETLTLDQMIQDTVAVTNYLRDRFGQEKIYLMGHSGGTFVGIHTAAREPQLYHAYVGVAQITSQLASEQLAYEHMLARFRDQGNQAMVRKLEAAPDSYLRVRDVAMHQLGVGTTRTMRSVVKGFYSFEQSAHSPHFEEPGRALRIMREDVLTGRVTLGDDG